MLKTLPKSKLRYSALALDAVLASARFGYRYFTDWPQLNPEQQAYLIAAYRTERGMHAYQEHEAAKASK
jgi:hypothetical protein